MSGCARFLSGLGRLRCVCKNSVPPGAIRAVPEEVECESRVHCEKFSENKNRRPFKSAVHLGYINEPMSLSQVNLHVPEIKAVAGHYLFINQSINQQKGLFAPIAVLPSYSSRPTPSRQKLRAVNGRPQRDAAIMNILSACRITWSVWNRDEMNILIAIDDSAYSKAALESVLSRPWPDDACFRVITVVEPFHPEYAGWQTNYVPLAIEAQKTQVETAEKLIDDAKGALQAKFSKSEVSGEVVEGYIKDKILQIANEWPAKLIILGSHGRRGFTKFLLGSVSEAVAAHAECSVEIVKMPRTQA